MAPLLHFLRCERFNLDVDTFNLASVLFSVLRYVVVVDSTTWMFRLNSYPLFLLNPIDNIYL